MTSLAGAKPRKLPVDAAALVEYYTEFCGIPAVLRRSGGLIVVRAGTVGAIVVPAPVATRLRRRLRLAAPVVIDRDSGSWTFLTGPVATHLRYWGHIKDALDRRGATMVAEGAEVPLPSPTDPSRCWYGAPPNDRYRPSPASIASALDKA